MRDQLIDGFLQRAGWGDAQVVPLAGDASPRRYFRLERGDEKAVLMDADPAKGEDVRPFADIGAFLLSQNLSAPEILARDDAVGFLLLEDLGDDLFARVVEHDPKTERRLYLAALDVLEALYHVPPPAGLPVLDPETSAAAIDLAYQWYAKGSDMAPAYSALYRLMKGISPKMTIALRDFHAENLIWLPQRSGKARVGLLDFQDACLAHPSYDLISLLRDARRDVSDALRTAMIDEFADRIGQGQTLFRRETAIVGIQRNIRILGIFARLSLHFGKPHYVDLIPRVWQQIEDDLSHPDLDELKAAVLHTLPKPTNDHLADLKARSGTCPAL